MQLSLQQSYYKDARTTVRLVDGLRNIYLGLKDLLGVTIIVVLAAIGFVFLILINLVLAYLVNRLEKSKPLDLTDVTSKEYSSLRKKHDDLGIRVRLLNEIAAWIKEGESEIPFLLKWTTNIAMKGQKVLVKRYENDAKSFEALAPKKETYKGFERLTEEQLWNDRAKTYEYLI